VGYVVSGRAELELEGQTVRLEAGDSWVVPAGRRTPTASWRRSPPSRRRRRRRRSTGGTSSGAGVPPSAGGTRAGTAIEPNPGPV
jgi:hypothetical protein